jgi:hypothetical protein
MLGCGQIHGILLCMATMHETTDASQCFHELEYVVTGFDVQGDGRIGWNSASSNADRRNPAQAKCMLDPLDKECSDAEKKIVARIVRRWQYIKSESQMRTFEVPFNCDKFKGELRN